MATVRSPLVDQIPITQPASISRRADYACGQTGDFELNVTMPIVTLRLLEAIEFSTNVINAFTEKCVVGIEVNEARCRSWSKKVSP